MQHRHVRLTRVPEAEQGDVIVRVHPVGLG